MSPSLVLGQFADLVSSLVELTSLPLTGGELNDRVAKLQFAALVELKVSYVGCAIRTIAM